MSENKKKIFNEEAGKQLAHICSWSKTTPDKVQALLDAGADPDWRQHDGENTPLMEVVRCQHNPELVRTLIKGGANVMLRDQHGRGYTALGKAHEGDVIRAMLEKDAHIQLTSRQPLTGTHLSHAVVDLDADCVSAMLEAGADPSGKANPDMPPLHWAIERRDAKKIDVLLKYRPETQINHAEKWDGYNPAMKLFNTHWGVSDEMTIHYCTLLMNMGTDLKHRDDHGRTLLYYIDKSSDKVKTALKKAYDIALFNQTISRAIETPKSPVPKSVMKRKGPGA